MKICVGTENLDLLEPIKGLEKSPIIYALLDPDTLSIRYIGKSLSGLYRPKSHTSPSNLKVDGNTKKSNWLNSILTQNKKPTIKVIEYTNLDIDRHSLNESLYKREQFFIKLLTENGFNLTNNTDGGPGSIGRVISEETRQKMSFSSKKAGLNDALKAQQKKTRPLDTETSRYCSKCKEHIKNIQFGKHTSYCKPCLKTFQRSRSTPGKQQRYFDSLKNTVIKIDPISQKETLILGFRDATKSIGGKCNKTGIRNSIKNGTLYYGFYWRLK